MAGWQLRDENGNVFTFPQLQLFEGGAINVWTTSGSASVVDLYWVCRVQSGNPEKMFP
jgi:hypothetical protein